MVFYYRILVLEHADKVMFLEMVLPSHEVDLPPDPFFEAAAPRVVSPLSLIQELTHATFKIPNKTWTEM